MPSKDFLDRKGSLWERESFEGKPLPEIRTEMDAQAMYELTIPEGITIESGFCGGVPGRWAKTAHGEGRILLYIHGGGFTLGSSGIAMPFVTELVKKLHIDSFSPDYRLAPEHKFPAGHEDNLRVYEELLSLGYQAKDIILAGESAGATYCLALLGQARECGLPLPAGVVAMSPVTDARPESQTEDRKVLEDLPGLEGILQIFAPEADPADPLLSPALGDLRGFPPVFLLAGGAEPLARDAILYAKNAAEAGVGVRLAIAKEMIHTYPLDFLDYPEAMEALEEITLFLRHRYRI
jgi:acetyl esterase/lipase